MYQSVNLNVYFWAYKYVAKPVKFVHNCLLTSCLESVSLFAQAQAYCKCGRPVTISLIIDDIKPSKMSSLWEGGINNIIPSLSLSTKTSIKACVISDSLSVFRRIHSYLVMHSLLLAGLDSLVSSMHSTFDFPGGGGVQHGGQAVRLHQLQGPGAPSSSTTTLFGQVPCRPTRSGTHSPLLASAPLLGQGPYADHTPGQGPYADQCSLYQVKDLTLTKHLVKALTLTSAEPSARDAQSLAGQCSLPISIHPQVRYLAGQFV